MVAIVGYAVSNLEWDVNKTREEAVFEVAKAALKSAGISREDVGTVISASSDFLDGRTISNCMLIGASGAYLRDESKAEEDGLYAALYAIQRLMAGVHDIALVVAHTHSWIFNPHQVTRYMLEPWFDRQNDMLDGITIAALQMRMYMARHGVYEEDVAEVSVKNLRNASKISHTFRKMPDVTVEDVLTSEVYAEPVTDLMISPPCDGAAAVVIASDEAAKGFDDPVWVKGVGNACDSYLRDRDLARLTSLEIAARKAYRMAGIEEPFREIDVAEITERFAHQEIMTYEALGFCRKGNGVRLLEEGMTEVYGDLPTNPSGGALAGDPICATGLIRLIEAVRQIRGEAENQVEDCRTALAHTQWGIAAQKNLVLILGDEP
ncbi:thiolase family protein [Archaeoglobus neptunius]|uniref:thiolase family protein n=1 Tax=Archaeoglobus neptunius TaxID=2798580 RepID=UPI001928BD7A|nr:thiolase family protein [Archaeoglobus neptunius]